MKILLFVLIVLIFLVSLNLGREKGRMSKLTKKQRACVIAVFCVSPVLLYVLITLLLAVLRGDNFVAYEVYIDNAKYICYKESYYVEITDEKELNKINEEVNGKWINEKEIVLNNPIKFPYIDYWTPDIMCNHLYHTQEEEYIIITYAFSGANEVYVRVE